MKMICNRTIIGILLATAGVTLAFPLRAQAQEQNLKAARSSIDHSELERHAGERHLLKSKCVGSTLEWGQELRSYNDYNEYICLQQEDDPKYGNFGNYRFGIFEGRVVVLNRYDEEIWGSDNQEPGTHIRLQKGGKLSLLDDNKKSVWAMKHGCKAPYGRLQIKKTGFFMLDGNDDVKWFIDFDGNESICDPHSSTFPADPCKEVNYDESSDTCRVLAFNTDTYNYEQVILEAKKLDNGSFQVTDVEKFCWFCDSNWNKNWSSLPPTTFDLSFSHSGALIINGKSSWDSCQTIVEYDDVDGASYYWRFYEVSDTKYECNTFGTNLLKFMMTKFEDDDVWGCISDC